MVCLLVPAEHVAFPSSLKFQEAQVESLTTPTKWLHHEIQVYQSLQANFQKHLP